MFDVNIDFYSDYAEYLGNQLKAVGSGIQGLGSDEIVYAYLNLKKRLIDPKPRQICKSKSFICPPKYNDTLVEIERKILSGENLLPYLSKEIRGLKYNDLMLNDWGIHHFHLGQHFPNNDFVQRTGDLAFIRFDQHTAYLIGIFDHRSWFKCELIRILHENWPQQMEPYRLKGLQPTVRSVSDSERKVLRRKRGNALIEFGDVVYRPLGGGYVIEGLSTQVVMEVDRLTEAFKNEQKNLIDQLESISNHAQNKE